MHSFHVQCIASTVYVCLIWTENVSGIVVRFSTFRKRQITTYRHRRWRRRH